MSDDEFIDFKRVVDQLQSEIQKEKEIESIKSRDDEIQFLESGQSEIIEAFVRRQDALIKRHGDENEARIKLINLLYILTVGWIAVTLTIVLLSGFELINLSDEILALLLGSATIEVLGMLGIVLQYLYNKKGTPDLNDLDLLSYLNQKKNNS